MKVIRKLRLALMYAVFGGIPILSGCVSFSSGSASGICDIYWEGETFHGCTIREKSLHCDFIDREDPDCLIQWIEYPIVESFINFQYGSL